ncbi:ABC transporter permease [Collinsella sp. AGMB00827]|uniref:ABC transporter permease n=1 Tax=Collinsella ureilytica TaxID=2869515 RepID=A0ABS7MME7_9ACTN|nr:ABC transporter permease [Collinsella urealyticum]MBY4797600.1 ABC transporter permease [Collinsella urealyticum]
MSRRAGKIPAHLSRKHTRKRLIASALLALALVAVAMFARHLAPYNPDAQLFGSLEPPSWEHLAGTDIYGRDMLSRILVGLETSVFSTLALVASITITGSAVGVASAYIGGPFDAFMMRVSDLCLAFPGLVFALAITAVLHGGLMNAILALGLISWPKYARIARSQTLALAHADFIRAARMAGSSPARVIALDILPNIAGQILITAMLDIGTMMMELAGLSFLGLGAQPPVAELGNMMSGGRSMLQTYPWVVLAPGVAIFIAVVIFNLLGDAVRDHLDPRGGTQGAAAPPVS